MITRSIIKALFAALISTAASLFTASAQEYNATPDPNMPLKELSEIMVKYPGVSTIELDPDYFSASVLDENYSYVPYSVEGSVIGNSVKLTVSPTLAQAGVYYVMVQEYGLILDGNYDEAGILLKYTIDPTLSPGDETNYAVTPASGSEVQAIKSIIIEFSDATAIKTADSFKTTVKCGNNDVTTAVTVACADNTAVLSFNPVVKEEGEYSVLIEKGALIVDDKPYDKSIELTYTVTPLKVGDVFTYENFTYQVKSFGPNIVELASASLKSENVIVPADVYDIAETQYKVASIAANCFYENDAIASISLPSSLVSIGNRAFYNCANLKSVEVAEGLESIGRECFYYCPNLSSITFPSSLKATDNSAFAYCYGLKSLEFPAGISIGERAFQECRNITSIKFNGDIASLEANAFFRCYALESINMISGLTRIPEYAFGECKSLESVSFAEGVEEIGKSAFSSCEMLDNAVLPSSLTLIDDYAFYNCGHLRNINLPVGLSNIGEGAFSACNWLSEIVIPENIKTIKVRSFDSCSKLSKVTLPAALESIEDKAFAGCSALMSIISFNTMPPAVEDSQVFGKSDVTGKAGVNLDECVVTVPQGSLQAYKKANVWKNFFNIEEDNTSVVDNISADENLPVVIYDLYGRKVNENIMNLKGIYIVNGKKVVF